MIATESSLPTPSYAKACASALVRLSTWSKVRLPRSSTMAVASG